MKKIVLTTLCASVFFGCIFAGCYAGHLGDLPPGPWWAFPLALSCIYLAVASLGGIIYVVTREGK